MTDIEPITATNPGPGLAKAVQERLDTAEAKASDKRPVKKPAGTKAPKPYIGYLVVNTGRAPEPKTRQSWIADVPQMFAHLKDAQAARDGFRAMAPSAPDKVILEATVTFRVVEGGGDA